MKTFFLIFVASLLVFLSGVLGEKEKEVILGDFLPSSSQMDWLSEMVNDVYNTNAVKSIEQIEVYGSSDSSGDYDKNMELAQERANTCENVFRERMPDVNIVNKGVLSADLKVVRARVCFVKIKFSNIFVNNDFLQALSDPKLLMSIAVFLVLVTMAFLKFHFESKKRRRSFDLASIGKRTASYNRFEVVGDTGNPEEEIECPLCNVMVLRGNWKRHQTKRCPRRRDAVEGNQEQVNEEGVDGAIEKMAASH